MTIQEQLKTLKKVFPKAKIELPKGFKSMAFFNGNAEYEQVIPHWTLVGKTYNEAVENVLDVIKKSRSFYNWHEGKLESAHLKETPEKKMALSQFHKKTFVIPIQTGERWKGKSVETVRKEKQSSEVLLGAYEVAIILLIHPDILKNYDDLWIDCAGDEYSADGDGRFVGAPFFYFRDGRLRFGSDWLDGAHDDYGSASGFFPQSDSGTLGSLEPFDSSTLEARIKKLEERMDKYNLI